VGCGAYAARKLQNRETANAHVLVSSVKREAGMKCASPMLFNLSLCVHFVALRIASLGGWSGGGAEGDVWRAGHFTCLLGLGGGGALGWFPQIAPPGRDSSTLITIRSHETLPFFSNDLFILKKEHTFIKQVTFCRLSLQSTF
jgi:hypothetical protein